jgi:hypothetical protein
MFAGLHIYNEKKEKKKKKKKGLHIYKGLSGSKVAEQANNNCPVKHQSFCIQVFSSDNDIPGQLYFEKHFVFPPPVVNQKNKTVTMSMLT